MMAVYRETFYRLMKRRRVAMASPVIRRRRTRRGDAESPFEYLNRCAEIINFDVV